MKIGDKIVYWDCFEGEKICYITQIENNTFKPIFTIKGVDCDYYNICTAMGPGDRAGWWIKLYEPIKIKTEIPKHTMV